MFRNRAKLNGGSHSSKDDEDKNHSIHFWPTKSRPMASFSCSKFLLCCQRLWNRRYRLIFTFIAVFVLLSFYIIFVKISSLDRRASEYFSFDDDDRPKIIIRDLENEDEQFENSLNDRVKDLLRIKKSVLEELQSLEQKRNKLREDINLHRAQLDIMEADAQLRNEELQHLRRSIDQTRLELQEVQEQNQPLLRAPLALNTDAISFQKSVSPPSDASNCTLETCFDYSQCSIVKNFGLYVYPSTIISSIFGFSENFDLKNLEDYFDFVSDPQEACLFVVILPSQVVPKSETFAKLPHWRGDGRNHLIFVENSNFFNFFSFGRAIFAQNSFDKNFRPRFDIYSPSLGSSENIPVWQNLPMLVPAKRKFLFSFLGQKTEKNLAENFFRAINDLDVAAESIHVEFNCSRINVDSIEPLPLCGDESFRATVLKISSFALL